MAEGTKFNLTKLNNANYSIWKFKLELLLIKEGLWDVVNKAKPTFAAENVAAELEWEKGNNQAKALIGLLVEDGQLVHIRRASSARDAWLALKTYHEKSTLSHKVHLMRKICNLKLEEGADVQNHINQMTELFDKLRDIGEELLSETWRVAMLLSSLPRSYDTLITALETRPEADLTYDLVQSKLLEEFSRRNEPSTETKESALKISDKREKNCFFCKEKGHFKKDCIQYKKWKSKSSKSRVDQSQAHKANKVETSPEFLFMVSKDVGGWIIDSGATCHISSNKRFFTDLNMKHHEKINVANGNEVKTEGRGSGTIQFLNQNSEVSSVTLHNVLYIPEIGGNLLSVRKLAEEGFTVDFKKDLCEIKHKGRQVAVADLQSSLYKLREYNKVYSACVHKCNCIHYWHRVCGHRDPQVVKEMVLNGQVDGVELVDCGIKCRCEISFQGKTIR